MRIVLLCGGSGKRLWPLSNEIRSKIFLKLLPVNATNAGSADSGKESMIQRVCRQLEEAGLLTFASVVAHQRQEGITQHHIGNRIPFIAEPHRRGTFHAITLAAAYLHAKQLAGMEETICVIPADLYADVDFLSMLCQFPSVLAASGAELALLGVTPGHPSTQFGYIVPKPDQTASYSASTASSAPPAGYAMVEQFTEKPDEATAEQLINRDAMWNCGIFAFSLKFILDIMARKGLPTDYDELLACYEQLPEQSFDVEVVEKTVSAAVIPYHREWRDLGDWNVLPHYLGGSKIVGAGSVSNDSAGTHIVNELQQPIHVIGVPNIIVAASSDGILVAHKQAANRIKSMHHDGQRLMYGEERWGSYRVLNYSLPEQGPQTMTRLIQLLPLKAISYHAHKQREEYWTILSGTGEFILEAASRQVQAGDMLHIPAGVKHAIRALSALEYIEVQIGNELDENDVSQLDADWDNIGQRNGPGGLAQP
ncbi:sugar phosphate nucleotidyltransferase [Paenibacillus sp. OV219]|uniref:sugar phosphate nucleotidyltransferase n=1 Tax=Paenibacillus sp. OV219 TaxID=1884377 RepID=UPI0008CB3F22|nr:sugar phosphate nucleotidyltransferase [Paenibacillus sp. OV219]SEP10297.1 mannose-1-phosphate guanylyltransferase [Paenibacillus sp. OV219]